MKNLMFPVICLHRLSDVTLSRYTKSDTCADITNHGRIRRCKANKSQHNTDVNDSCDKNLSKTEVIKKESIRKSRNSKSNPCYGKRRTSNRNRLKVNARKAGILANQTAKTKALQVIYKRNTTEKFSFSCKMCQYKSKEKLALDLHMQRCHKSHKLWHGSAGSYPTLQSHLVEQNILQNQKIARNKTNSQTNVTAKQKTKVKKLLGTTWTLQLKCHVCKTVCENRAALIMHAKLHKTQEVSQVSKTNNSIENPQQTTDSDSILNSIEEIIPSANKVANISDREANNNETKASNKGMETERQLYECQFCHKRFARTRFLRYHINYVHRSKNTQSVSSQIKTKPSKSTHPRKKKERNNNLFSCNICPYSTTYNYRLTQHKKQVHEGKKRTWNTTISCDLCPYSTTDKYNFTRHKKHVHEGKTSFSCDLCPYSTTEKCNFTRHEANIHKGNTQNRNSSTKFSCNFCPFSTKYNDHLTRHKKRVHEGTKQNGNNTTFSCDLCPYSTIDNRNFVRHKKTVHESRKLYCVKPNKIQKIQHCHLCSYFSKDGGNLSRHLRVRHQIGNILQCYHCSFTTFAHDKLKRHVKSMHDGKSFVSAPKVCQKCHTQFASHYEMKCHQWSHLRNHTSCDTSTSIVSNDATNTENHKKSAIVDSLSCNKILYKCDYCEKQFARKSYLKDHIDYNHSADLSVNSQSCDEHKPQKSQIKTIMAVKQENTAVNNKEVGQEISKISRKVKPRTGSADIKCPEANGPGKVNMECKFCLVKCINGQALLSHLKRHVTPWGRPYF